MDLFLIKGQGVFFFGVAVLVVTLAIYFFQRKGITLTSEFTGGTPTLDHFSIDLTKLAKRGELDPIIGRGMEIDQLTRILGRRTKNNAVLIGEAGIGKTTIVEGLAQNIADKKVTSDLQNKRVLALNLNSLIAGTKYRGEFEERIKRITSEIENSKRNIILFIDEVHGLLGAESSGESLSVGDILKPAMSRGDLQLIGATTQQEYETYFEKDPAFKRRIQPIYIEEPDEKETIEILRGVRKMYENYHQVKILDEALRSCVERSKKIFPNRFYPDKAIDLMDETASKVKIENSDQENKTRKKIPVVTDNDIRIVAKEYQRQ